MKAQRGTVIFVLLGLAAGVAMAYPDHGTVIAIGAIVVMLTTLVVLSLRPGWFDKREEERDE